MYKSKIAHIEKNTKHHIAFCVTLLHVKIRYEDSERGLVNIPGSNNANQNTPFLAPSMKILDDCLLGIDHCR